MALTTAQQNKVVQLLGYGGKTLDPGSVIYDKVLADRLLNLNPDTEALAVAYLAQITVIETQLAQAPARVIAEKVGDITINKDEIARLRRERKVIAREVSALLDIPYIARGGANVSMVS